MVPHGKYIIFLFFCFLPRHILVNLTNSISSWITKLFTYVVDEVRNVHYVPHACGVFIWGTALVWTQRLFKNLVHVHTDYENANSLFWTYRCLDIIILEFFFTIYIPRGKLILTPLSVLKLGVSGNFSYTLENILSPPDSLSVWGRC